MISHGADAGPVYPSVTMAEAVFGAAGDPARQHRPAVVDATSGRGPSHAELAAAVGAAAAGLAREGVGPGTVVALHLPDTPEFALALHAVAAAGAIPFPVRATVPAAELARLLKAAGARVLVTWPVLLDIAKQAVDAAGGAVERLYCFGDEPDAVPFGRLLAAGGAAPDVAVDPARAPALIACTRGLAGPARPVVLTHAEVVAGLVRVAGAGMIGAADTVLTALPFADVLGLNGLLNPALRVGATVVARPGAGRHDLLRALQDHRVTVAVLPPELVETLAYDRAVTGYRLRSLRAVVATGGPLGAEAARACATRLGCPVRQAYGLAEAAGFTHLNLRAAEEGTHDSVGRGLPGITARVVDPGTGADQPAYQPGELCLRLPAAGVPGAVPRWLPAGDAAFADEHGRVYVLGRVGADPPEPPAEPDAVLAAHPAVSDAAVAAAPDLDLGLVPHAFAVLTEPVPAADLLAYVNGHVPAYRRVLAVHVVDSIPRGAGGRVQRRALLESAGLAP
ncbi:AMP-binding protein [Actinomadura macrotermitis]|uniref:Long-chain-fatty-acid--CoA ligase n=1 Tax=Actinomadura macrotermitis TaxID=2585200 RepID=A0A7K0C2T0_9ACTN|nr:AMP-binding protein [Actinomadura macrotermitis]MQY07741.1 Long-chain-fatty-acid--CoA ligase [Actinomadura macrotermitis]